MAEPLSIPVREDITDAYLIAQQLRLGSTRESHIQSDEDLLTGRTCARIARDLAKETSRKKTLLKSIVRT